MPPEPLDDEPDDADDVRRERTVLDVAVPVLVALVVLVALLRPWTW